MHGRARAHVADLDDEAVEDKGDADVHKGHGIAEHHRPESRSCQADESDADLRHMESFVSLRSRQQTSAAEQLHNLQGDMHWSGVSTNAPADTHEGARHSGASPKPLVACFIDCCMSIVYPAQEQGMNVSRQMLPFADPAFHLASNWKGGSMVRVSRTQYLHPRDLSCIMLSLDSVGSAAG